MDLDQQLSVTDVISEEYLRLDLAVGEQTRVSVDAQEVGINLIRFLFGGNSVRS